MSRSLDQANEIGLMRRPLAGIRRLGYTVVEMDGRLSANSQHKPRGIRERDDLRVLTLHNMRIRGHVEHVHIGIGACSHDVHMVDRRPDLECISPSRLPYAHCSLTR